MFTNTAQKFTVQKLVRQAHLAGQSVGMHGKRLDGHYADFVLDSGLSDDQRERLGYAMHSITRATTTGLSAAGLWAMVQHGLGAATGRPLNLAAADDAGLGILAFTAGACATDRQVYTEVSAYLRAVLRGRQFATATD